MVDTQDTEKIFDLHYTIEDNGDGTASFNLQPSDEEVDRIWKEIGYGLILGGNIKIKLENGRLFYFQNNQWLEAESA